ncbi:hypothetical protein ACKLNO_02215 [Neisseriaceae bacterium B1]
MDSRLSGNGGSKGFANFSGSLKPFTQHSNNQNDHLANHIPSSQ